MSSSKLVSVAIDFGTTFSGYAFSFRHNKENIQTYLWRAQNYESPKTPTCILFNPLKRFHSFGLEAEDKYGELSRTAEAESWYFFKQFKLALHNTKVFFLSFQPFIVFTSVLFLESLLLIWYLITADYISQKYCEKIYRDYHNQIWQRSSAKNKINKNFENLVS